MSKCIICGGPLNRHYPSDMQNVCLGHSYSQARQAADEAVLKATEPQEAMQDHAYLVAAARAAVEAFTRYDSEAHPLTIRYNALFNSMKTLADELKKV